MKHYTPYGSSHKFAVVKKRIVNVQVGGGQAATTFRRYILNKLSSFSSINLILIIDIDSIHVYTVRSMFQ